MKVVTELLGSMGGLVFIIGGVTACGAFFFGVYYITHGEVERGLSFVVASVAGAFIVWTAAKLLGAFDSTIDDEDTDSDTGEESK